MMTAMAEAKIGRSIKKLTIDPQIRLAHPAARWSVQTASPNENGVFVAFGTEKNSGVARRVGDYPARRAEGPRPGMSAYLRLRGRARTVSVAIPAAHERVRGRGPGKHQWYDSNPSHTDISVETDLGRR
jgi:hypothetical protein